MLDKALPEEVLAIGERSDYLPLLVSFYLRWKLYPPCTLTPERNTETISCKESKAFLRPLTPGHKQML